MAAGPRPAHLNPLDPGLAAPALAAAVGTQRQRIGENLRTRTLAVLEALLAITGGRALSATGRRLLAAALDQTTAARIEPTIPDLLHARRSARTRSRRSWPPMTSAAMPGRCGGW